MAEKTAKVERSSGGKFKKGTSKPPNSGRKKGTPNKKTRQFLEELGDFSTVKEMIKLFLATEDDGIKFSILKEFLKYEYPQRKAVEMNATFDTTETTQEAFLKHLKELGNNAD
jgi:hypothetical protein